MSHDEEMPIEEQITLDPQFGTVIWKHHFEKLPAALNEIGVLEKWDQAILKLCFLADDLREALPGIEKVGWPLQNTDALDALIAAIPSGLPRVEDE